jgi:hypothetical protein
VPAAATAADNRTAATAATQVMLMMVLGLCFGALLTVVCNTAAIWQSLPLAFTTAVLLLLAAADIRFAHLRWRWLLLLLPPLHVWLLWLHTQCLNCTHCARQICYHHEAPAAPAAAGYVTAAMRECLLKRECSSCRLLLCSLQLPVTPAYAIMSCGLLTVGVLHPAALGRQRHLLQLQLLLQPACSRKLQALLSHAASLLLAAAASVAAAAASDRPAAAAPASATLTDHGVCLARPRGSIRKDSAVQPLGHPCCKLLYAAHVHITVTCLQHSSNTARPAGTSCVEDVAVRAAATATEQLRVAKHVALPC